MLNRSRENIKKAFRLLHEKRKKFFTGLDFLGRLSFVFICLSLALRFFGLNHIPLGFDFDESIILYFGKEAILKGAFLPFANNYTSFEMLSAYLYGLFDFIFPFKVRFFVGLLSVFELFLFYKLSLKVLRDKNKALVSLAFLSLLPWHFFYSRIIGTCTGVNIFAIAILLLLQARGKSLLIHVMGLFYYSGYRLFFIASSLHALFFLEKKERFKSLAFLFCSVLLVFLLIAVSESSIAQFFYRGTYNWNHDSRILLNIFYSLLFVFVPVFNFYSQISPTFIADYIHETYALVLGKISVLNFSFAFPLSLPITILFLLGLSLLVIKTLGSIFYAKKMKIVSMKGIEKVKGERPKDIFETSSEARDVFIKLLLLLLVTYVSISFLGPSFSRFIVILPSVAIFSAYAFSWIHERISLKGSSLILLFSLLLMLGQNILILYRLSHDEKIGLIFHSDYLFINDYIKKKWPDVPQEKILMAAQNLHFLPAYIAQNSKAFTALEPLPASALIPYIQRTMRSTSINEDFTSQFAMRENAQSKKEKDRNAFYLILRKLPKQIRERRDRNLILESEYLEKIRHYLRSHFEILERGEIKNRELLVAEFYKLLVP